MNNLARVTAQRELRAADAALSVRVIAVKAWQHARFESCYGDLLSSRRYSDAARFFLTDLYGAGDFTTRDEQFAKVVPALVRLFPRDIVETVSKLAELHAVTEELDTDMARVADAIPLDEAAYVVAWRTINEPALRQRQVSLMWDVGRALDRYTRKPLMRHSLRLMRAPAHASGLGALQSFLERGFDAFRKMQGAEEFLQTIADRETAFAAHMSDRE